TLSSSNSLRRYFESRDVVSSVLPGAERFDGAGATGFGRGIRQLLPRHVDRPVGPEQPCVICRRSAGPNKPVEAVFLTPPRTAASQRRSIARIDHPYANAFFCKGIVIIRSGGWCRSARGSAGSRSSERRVAGTACPPWRCTGRCDRSGAEEPPARSP